MNGSPLAPPTLNGQALAHSGDVPVFAIPTIEVEVDSNDGKPLVLELTRDQARRMGGHLLAFGWQGDDSTPEPHDLVASEVDALERVA